MQSGLRDLDQLKEREHGAARRAMLLVLATAMTTALAVSVAVLVRRSTAAPSAVPDDPLAALATRLDPATARARETPAPEPPAAETLRNELTFPEVLAGREAAPEVEAAILAAAAEIENPDPLPPPADWRLPVTDAPPPAARAADPATEAAQPTAEAARLPAANVATPARGQLARTSERDPLVAASLPVRAEGTPAAAGSEGNYTLQVISYRNAGQARDFAAALRARGHTAFVTTVSVARRGLTYRVRIGPFATLGRALAYSRQFEEREQIHPIVVRLQRHG